MIVESTSVSVSGLFQKQSQGQGGQRERFEQSLERAERQWQKPAKAASEHEAGKSRQRGGEGDGRTQEASKESEVSGGGADGSSQDSGSADEKAKEGQSAAQQNQEDAAEEAKESQGAGQQNQEGAAEKEEEGDERKQQDRAEDEKARKDRPKEEGEDERKRPDEESEGDEARMMDGRRRDGEAAKAAASDPEAKPAASDSKAKPEPDGRTRAHERQGSAERGRAAAEDVERERGRDGDRGERVNKQSGRPQQEQMLKGQPRQGQGQHVEGEGNPLLRGGSASGDGKKESHNQEGRDGSSRQQMKAMLEALMSRQGGSTGQTGSSNVQGNAAALWQNAMQQAQGQQTPDASQNASPQSSANTGAAGQGVASANLANTSALIDGPDGDLNAARLARGLQNAVNQRGGGMTLRLTPPEMGTVRIQMQMQGPTVSAQMHTETDGARQLLNQQLGQLRQVLESQGLSVERLSVQQMGNSSSSQGAMQQGTDQSQDDGRSRGGHQQRQHQGQRRDDREGDGRNGSRQSHAFEEWLNEEG
jgi:hypothetical protein